MQEPKWREILDIGVIEKAKNVALKHTDFGDGHGIIMGLRFGEAAPGSKSGEEPENIWSPITAQVVTGWSRYCKVLSLSKLGNSLRPEYIQIDDREWSLVFDVDESVDRSRLEDFADFLVNFFFPSIGASFGVWLKEFLDLDSQTHKRLGVWVEFRPEVTWDESQVVEARETPLLHFEDGSLKHLKRRAFNVCPICGVSGNVWCDDSQIAALELSEQTGNDQLLWESFSIWDIVTFTTGIHQWCAAEKLSSEQLQQFASEARKNRTA
jgi:hypothetical protein